MFSKVVIAYGFQVSEDYYRYLPDAFSSWSIDKEMKTVFYGTLIEKIPAYSIFNLENVNLESIQNKYPDILERINLEIDSLVVEFADIKDIVSVYNELKEYLKTQKPVLMIFQTP